MTSTLFLAPSEIKVVGAGIRREIAPVYLVNRFVNGRNTWKIASRILRKLKSIFVQLTARFNLPIIISFNIVAIFVVQFDTHKGNDVEWQYPKGI